MPDPRDPAADPLAVALAKLAPAPADLATPEFLFAAGRASEARRVAFWRRLCLAQAALGCAACVVVAAGVATPAAVPDAPASPPVAEVAAPPASPSDGPTLDERIEALRLRNDVLALGLSALPEPVPRPTPYPFEDDR